MDCERLREVLIEHVDGLLVGEEADLARTHLAACAPCRSLQEEVRRNFAALDCWEDEDLPAGAFERLRARIPSGPAVPPRLPMPRSASRRPWIRVLVPYAAGLATAAAAMAFFVIPRGGAPRPEGPRPVPSPVVPVPPPVVAASGLKPGESPLVFRVADEGIVRKFLLPEGVDPQNILLVDDERPIPVPSGVR